MNEQRWQELLRRYPGRCIYPGFDPDREQEPWTPQMRDWRRADTRQTTPIVHRRGWPGRKSGGDDHIDEGHDTSTVHGGEVNRERPGQDGD